MRINLCKGDSIFYVTQMISRILETKQIKGWYGIIVVTRCCRIRTEIYILYEPYITPYCKSKTEYLRNEVYLNENKTVVNKTLITQ